MKFLVGNFFSFFCSLFLLLSIFSKKKERLMTYQIINVIIEMGANFILSAYSGFIILIFALARNIIVMKDKMSKLLSILIISGTIITVLIFNKADKYWYIVLIGNLSYTIPLCFKGITILQIKIALFFNLVLWSIYEVLTMQYPSAITDGFLSIVTLYAIYKLIVRNSDTNGY